MQKGGTEVNLGGIKGFAVHPKDDCPHIKVSHINTTHALFDVLKGLLLPGVCKDCESKEENWICLVCNGVFCSRYVKGHMAEHNATTKHEIAMSYTDGSIWCYECDSYITSTPLTMLQCKFSSIKFPDGDDREALQELTEAFDRNLSLQEKKKQEPKFEMKSQKYSRQKFIQDIKEKKKKNIVFLTGAGISVSAGIPDFRTPGTGLYSKLAQYNLPTPQAIFQLNFFKQNPEPFYKLSKELFSAKVSPTITHKFIKKLEEMEQISKVITQNIDGLQLIAGLSESNLVQAHGHYRSIHCLDCKKSGEVAEFLECVQKQEVMRCFCGGFMKPDIVFFGQQLPASFGQCPDIMDTADMVIVMGTSLVVFPFAFLIEMVQKDVPVILINNTNSLKDRFPNSLWLDGNLDDQVQKLMKDLEWSI